MAKLRFLFKDEEEEKEKFGIKQRTRGIGELPKFGKIGLEKAEEIEIPKSTKLKFTADVDLGVGAKAAGGLTLPETVEPQKRFAEKPEESENILSNLLATMEDYKRQINELESIGKERPFVEVELRNYRYAIGQYNRAVNRYNELIKKPEPKPITEGLPISKPEDRPEALFEDKTMQEIHKVNFESYKLWFRELKESKNKVAFLKGEGHSPELKELREKYNKLAPYMFKKSEQWISNVSMIAVGIGMAYQLVNAAVTSGFKVKDKVINAKELKGVLERARANYIPETGKFKATLSDNDYTIMKQLNYFLKTTKKSPVAREMLEKVVEKTGGLSFPQQVNIFGGKLYAGLPADEIAKSIVQVGKVTAKVVKGLDPAKAIQIYQALLNTSPALASEFTKAIAAEETYSVELKYQEAHQEKLIHSGDWGNNDIRYDLEGAGDIFRELSKTQYQDMGYIGEKLDRIERTIKYDSENTIKDKLTQNKEKIPQLISLWEKQPIQTPEQELAKDLNIALAKGKIEEVKGYIEKLNTMELEPTRERLLKLPIEKAEKVLKRVEPVVREEIPKVEIKAPTIPKELEPLAEEAKKYNNVEEFINSQMPPPDRFGYWYSTKIKNYNQNVQAFDIDEAKEKALKGYGDYVERKGIDYGWITKKDVDVEEILTKDNMTKKQQLTDFYNKAIESIAKPEPKPPAEPIEKIEEVLKKVEKPIVKEEIPKVEPKPPTKIELATPKQIQEANIFAKEHKLITETPSGKMSDLRYKRLAKNMTGKTSVKDMTKEEADEFIESIKGIVQRRPWEPPIIPLSTKIVPKEFFEIEFKEPGISKIITPKKYYLRILGAEPLLKDLIDSSELLSLKTGEINKWVNDVIRKINKEATIAQKFKARVFNRPTDKVATMRDLLDKYENPPDYLKSREKEIFKEVRDFTKDILIKTNEVRDRVGLEPIKEIKTYIPHFLDELAKQIVNKKYPFPEDVKYWLGRNMPKKVYNPTAMERRVRDDLEKFFSKDLGALLRTLAKYDLRDIYLSEPYSILRVELSALGDRIPASTRKEIDLFLRHDIFNYPTDLDQMLNKNLEKPTDVINFFLKPFNRIISNPISSLSNVYRQGLMGGAIAMKPRLVLRNLLTQKLLNMNIYPIKDYLKAQFWLTPKGVMDEIRDTTFYKLSIRKFEDLPPLLKPIQWGMYPYSKSHAGINYISNVDVSGKVGYYYGKDMIAWVETPKGKAYIEKYAKKHNLTGKAKDDLVWRKGDEKDEAIEAMSVTQWLYFSTDMPRVFRGKGARAFWSLQSWWMNWFGKHLREGLIRMGGKTSRGRIVRPGDRINLIKGLAVIFALTEAVRKETGIDMKRFLFFPFPTYIYPPAMQLMLNTYYFITADTEQKRKSAISGLKNNLKLLIPFSGAWRRYWQFIRGEITLKEWLFYMERKKKGQPPLKITIPKSGELKFTEPEINVKSNKLKFTF